MVYIRSVKLRECGGVCERDRERERGRGGGGQRDEGKERQIDRDGS